MTILVTGSAGHLGAALVLTLRARGADVRGLDILPSPETDAIASIEDRDALRAQMQGVETVLHAATLHKPHVATHARQDFVDVNITGTLNLLEEAAAARIRSFIFTSTTSTFGDAMRPAPGAPAAWTDENLIPSPRNIYSVTKVAAEAICELMHKKTGLPVLILRTSRFFPEADDNRDQRDRFEDANLKVNELTYRRVDIADAVEAHLLAAAQAPEIGFDRYIISAPTPFAPEDVAELHQDAPEVLRRRVPQYESIYSARGWSMLPVIDRVYDSRRAQHRLGWRPRYSFAHALAQLAAGDEWRSPLARQVGARGYHAQEFEDGPFPVEP